MADTLVTERPPRDSGAAAEASQDVTEQLTPTSAGDEAPRATPAWPPPRVIWWVVALYVVVLSGYAVLLPSWVGPDEVAHVDLSHYVAKNLSYPRWDERYLTKGFAHQLEWARHPNRSRDLTAKEAVPRQDRPSIEELLHTRKSRYNQQPQHPPLYYALTGGLARLVEDAPGDMLRAFDMQNWFFRMLSVLMVAPLPLIIWAIAARLRLPDAVGLAAALIPLAIPQFTHIMSLANNDALIVPTVSLTVLACVPLMQGDLRSRTALLAGGATGLALFTKGMTVLLPFWAGAAIALGFWRTRGEWLRDSLRSTATRVLRIGGLFGGAALVLGGWWWVRNIILFGQFAPTLDAERFKHRNFTPEPLWWVVTYLKRMDQSFWGRFGYSHVWLSTRSIVLASAIFLVALMLAFRPRAAREPVSVRALLLGVWPAIALPTASRSYSVYSQSHALPGMQGRYWFGAIAPLAVLVAIGAGSVAGRFIRYLPLVAVAGGVAMQFNAVTTLLNFFWGGPGASLADRLRAMLAWSPLPGELVVAGALLGAVVVGLAVWQIAGWSRAKTRLA